jgi:hypothetical protein
MSFRGELFALGAWTDWLGTYWLCIKGGGTHFSHCGGVSRYGSHRRHRFQPLFYCCIRVCCGDHVTDIEPLPSNGRVCRAVSGCLWCLHNSFSKQDAVSSHIIHEKEYISYRSGIESLYFVWPPYCCYTFNKRKHRNTSWMTLKLSYHTLLLLQSWTFVALCVFLKVVYWKKSTKVNCSGVMFTQSLTKIHQSVLMLLRQQTQRTWYIRLSFPVL